MNKTELVKALAEKTGFTQKDITVVMDALQGVAFSTLRSGDEVKLMDGVTLTTVYKEATTARNPKTGESVAVAAKTAPKCKFGKAVKDAVNA